MVIRVLGIDFDWQSGWSMTSGVCQELRDSLLDQCVIHERQRNFFRYVQPDISPVVCVALEVDWGLEESAHTTPLAFRTDYSALEPIHVQKVVYYAIKS